MRANPQHVKPAQGPQKLTQDPAKLRWERHAKRMTIPQLAALSGRSVGCISQLERGKKSANVVTLGLLADALGCDVADIMADKPGTQRVAVASDREDAA